MADVGILCNDSRGETEDEWDGDFSWHTGDTTGPVGVELEFREVFVIAGKMMQLVSVLLFCPTLAVQADGQSCKAQFVCSVYDLRNAECIPHLPATATNCGWNGPFSTICDVATVDCPPAPECPSCAKAGHPISLATGNTSIAQTDLRIPGIGGGLTLVRTWNSVWPAAESANLAGSFGPGWRSTFEERVFPGSDGFLKYSRGDGSFWSFGYSGTSGNNPQYAVAAPASETASLAQGTPTTANWILTFKSGEQRTFDATSGKLLSIVDRNGNNTQLTYDSSGRLVDVADPVGRHLVFSYASPSGFLVTSVSSNVGQVLSYSYDDQGRLLTVTKPDSSTVSFQYRPNSGLITAVLDTDGKILESHTYNSCGQGLTSTRLGGVEAVTISYPPLCDAGAAGR